MSNIFLPADEIRERGQQWALDLLVRLNWDPAFQVAPRSHCYNAPEGDSTDWCIQDAECQFLFSFDEGKEAALAMCDLLNTLMGITVCPVCHGPTGGPWGADHRCLGKPTHAP